MHINMDKYKSLARQAIAEGCVLLENKNQTLPLKKGCRVASFGRSQFNYYKSGDGSGGCVNTDYVISILDAIKASDHVVINESVSNSYAAWLQDNPIDIGKGWGPKPQCQQEMPLSEALVQKASEESEIALISIGRIAGEDNDNLAIDGSYLLTADEEKMLDLVCRRFKKTIVLLNVGNIIDMKWVEKYQPSAVLYVWQGGQEGGNGVLDILTGKVSPSGKLADSIARNICDYPSTANFGNAEHNYYVEDIYVGYRYFETFAKEKVLYPFGFGLSYTTFEQKILTFKWNGKEISVDIEVTNIGAVSGKEVVQLYKEAPQGMLGKPSRELCGFAKTKMLEPGENEILTIRCEAYYLASYDDSGASGYLSAYVMERGRYFFYAGSDVRNAVLAGTFRLDKTLLVEQLSTAMSPVMPFKRMRATESMNGPVVGYEAVPLRTYNLWERIRKARPSDISYTGNRGYQLKDVKDEKVTMQEFIAQMEEEQLFTMLRGEGMHSQKVKPDTAGVFGGLSSSLNKYGIPIASCCDGPSGIRMDDGTVAFSIPNGTCLACSFNEKLSEKLFEMLGRELHKNQIDILLGPGINLHRNPLNGRNFEYFSEDPFLTGRMAVAQLKGMHKHHVTGTIKHFIGNNQEYERKNLDCVISERAIRELYLKGFEMAVKEGGAYSIMSSYGSINGLFTASNFDLLTHILRKEWKYDGLVMTDWGANGNEEGEEGHNHEVAAMVRSQNDIFMAVKDAEKNSGNDNLPDAVHTEKLTLGEVQRSVANVLNVLMRTLAMERYILEERGVSNEQSIATNQYKTRYTCLHG